MNPTVNEWVFLPCAEGRHSACMAQFRRADGSVASRCTCVCGHGHLYERELTPA